MDICERQRLKERKKERKKDKYVDYLQGKEERKGRHRYENDIKRTFIGNRLHW